MRWIATRWAWCRCRGSKSIATSIFAANFDRESNQPRLLSRQRQGLHRSGHRTNRRPEKMQIISGTQEYDIRANWKLLVENSVDDYHLISTYLGPGSNYMREFRRQHHAAEGRAVADPRLRAGISGNGHLTTDNQNAIAPWPVAKWISVYGEDAKADIDAMRDELVARLGSGSARRPRRRYQPQSRDLPEPRHQRRLHGHGAPLLSGGAGPHACHRLGARSGGRNRGAARAASCTRSSTFYGPGGFATHRTTSPRY